MAKIWEPAPIEVYKAWIESIMEEASDDLNDWETNFIDSLYHRILGGTNLTELQAEKLERIYSEKTK